jgi:hypothetical protein
MTNDETEGKNRGKNKKFSVGKIIFRREKNIKKSQNNWNQGFFTFFA